MKKNFLALKEYFTYPLRIKEGKILILSGLFFTFSTLLVTIEPLLTKGYLLIENLFILTVSVIVLVILISFSRNFSRIDRILRKNNINFYPLASFGFFNGIIKNINTLTKKIKQSKDEIEKFKTLLNSVNACGIIVIDEEMNVLLYNEKVKEIFLLERNYKGKKLHDLTLIPRISELIQKIPSQSFTTITTGTNERKHLLLETTSINKLKLVQIKDETELQNLKNLNNSIMGIISHEIRTPMTNIKLCVENIVNLGKVTPDIYQILLSNIKRLESVLSNIVFLSSYQLNRVIINKIHFNMKELINEVIENLKYSYSDKHLKITFSYEGSEEITSDKDKLSLILYNLIDNALKFSRESGEVRINFYSLERSHIIEVKDNGIGIPEDEVDKIFDKFYRARNVKNEKGSGLGLSVTKALVEILNGEIKVESKLNEGTTFKVILQRKYLT